MTQKAARFHSPGEKSGLNPKYADRQATATAPRDDGERLATFPRGEGVELRVSLAEFNGHPFISLRPWEQGRDGSWWPEKGKGCSVRLGEAAALAEALGRVEPPVPRNDREADQPRPRGTGRARSGTGWKPPYPPVTATSSADGFDEFSPGDGR